VSTGISSYLDRSWNKFYFLVWTKFQYISGDRAVTFHT